MNGWMGKNALIACFVFLGQCARCEPIPLRCLIVGGDGGVLPVSAETVSNKVNEVNRIFRQAAMSFAVESCVVTNAVGLFEIDGCLSVRIPGYQFSKRRLNVLRDAERNMIIRFNKAFITNAINELVSYPEADLPE